MRANSFKGQREAGKSLVCAFLTLYALQSIAGPYIKTFDYIISFDLIIIW